MAAIHHRRLCDQITDRIRDEILCGKLGEGKTLLESYAEHKAIVAAIESRRIRAALAALKANIH